MIQGVGSVKSIDNPLPQLFFSAKDYYITHLPLEMNKTRISYIVHLSCSRWTRCSLHVWWLSHTTTFWEGAVLGSVAVQPCDSDNYTARWREADEEVIRGSKRLVTVQTQYDVFWLVASAMKWCKRLWHCSHEKAATAAEPLMYKMQSA